MGRGRDRAPLPGEPQAWRTGKSPAEVEYDLTWTTHKKHFVDDLADAVAHLTQAALRSAWAKANLTRCASADFYVVACRNPKLKDSCRAVKEELPVGAEEFDDGVEEVLCRGERGEAHGPPPLSLS